MCNFIRNLLQKQISQNLTIDLTRWNKFLAESEASINSIINQNHIDDVGAALIHIDNKSKQRFINSAYLLGVYDELKKAINKKQGLSKYESDKAKLLLLSTFEAKGLTPLLGFQHL